MAGHCVVRYPDGHGWKSWRRVGGRLGEAFHVVCWRRAQDWTCRWKLPTRGRTNMLASDVQVVDDDEVIELGHFSSQSRFSIVITISYQPAEAAGLDSPTPPPLLRGNTVGLTPDIATEETIRLHRNLHSNLCPDFLLFLLFASRASALAGAKSTVRDRNCHLKKVASQRKRRGWTNHG